MASFYSLGAFVSGDVLDGDEQGGTAATVTGAPSMQPALNGTARTNECSISAAGPSQPIAGACGLSTAQSTAADAVVAREPEREGAGAYGSISSFYPLERKGGSNASSVYGKQGKASLPVLTWTKRGRAEDRQEDAEEREDSRERRHRSSWHATLNKRIVGMNDADELLTVANEMLNGFDMLNTITSLNRLSRLRGARSLSRDPRALEILYKIEAWLSRAGLPMEGEEVCEVVLPKHLASITTALARLRWKESTAGRILRQVAQVGPGILHQARPRDLSNLAWSYATLELRSFEMLLLAVAREAVVQIHEFNEQNLSNCCWAFAKIGLRHDPLIKAIADETMKKLPQFSAQGLTNTIWGFATLIIKGEEILGQSSWQLICALLEEIIRRLPDCTTQELSNSSWACCRLGVRHEGFMAAIAARGTQLLADYTPQDLANTSMAFAKPNVDNRPFLEAMAREAGRKMQQFEAREVSNLTWAMMIMSHDILTPAWIDKALEHMQDLIGRNEYEGWEMVQVINAIWVHRASLAEWPSLNSIFERRVYRPVVSALAGIVCRSGTEPQLELDKHEGSAPVRNAGPLSSWKARVEAPESPLERARQEAQRIIKHLEVDFLGPVFTRVALRELGFVDPADQRGMDAFCRPCQPSRVGDESPAWGEHARSKVADALAQLKASLPFMWFDRFGPHERRVMCWVAYRLHVEIPASATAGSFSETLLQDGRIADFSLDEHRAMCKHGEETFARLEASTQSKLWFSLTDVKLAQQWLQGLFAQHDRGGHAERQGLLEIVLEIVGAVRRLRHQQCSTGDSAQDPPCLRSGFFDGSQGAKVRGHLRMFVCHFYCISCMAAISNFARRFPEVTIHADYDNVWETRMLDV